MPFEAMNRRSILRQGGSDQFGESNQWGVVSFPAPNVHFATTPRPSRYHRGMTNLSFPNLDLAQFPIAHTAQTTQRPDGSDRFASALTALDQHVVANAIPNVAFTDLKSPIRRAMNDAWKHHVAGPFFYGQKANCHEVDQLFFSLTADSLHLIESYLKRIDACTVQTAPVLAMRAVMQEFLPLAQRFAYLKDKIVKRQVKTEDQKAAEQRFVPTPATPAATKMVWQFLIDVAERNKADLVLAFTDEYKRLVTSYMGASPKEQKKMYCRPDFRAPVHAATKAGLRLSEPRTWLPDADAKILALAEESATALRDQFAFKVLRKLAPIVEAKGNLSSIEEVARSVRVGQLTGTMHIQFADGSRFLVDNTVVHSYSIHGKPFVRFPLTFHAAVMPDGASMKKPCEERMHTHFAGVPYRPQEDLANDDGDENEDVDGPAAPGAIS